MSQVQRGCIIILTHRVTATSFIFDSSIPTMTGWEVYEPHGLLEMFLTINVHDCRVLCYREDQADGIPRS